MVFRTKMGVFYGKNFIEPARRLDAKHVEMMGHDVIRGLYRDRAIDPLDEEARKLVGASVKAEPCLEAADLEPDMDEPVEGYNSLGVAKVLDLLPELSVPELIVMRDYETLTKNRSTVLKAIDKHLEKENQAD